MSPDCGTAVPMTPPVEVGETPKPVTVNSRSEGGWPEALSASPPTLAAIRQELKTAFTAYSAAQKAQDVLPPLQATEEQERAYHDTMDRHTAAMRALVAFEATTPAELLEKVVAMESVEADRPEGLVTDAFETLCADVRRSVGVTTMRQRTGRVLVPPEAEHDGAVILLDLDLKLRASSEAWALIHDDDEAWTAASVAHNEVLDQIASFQPTSATELAAKLRLLASPAAEGALDDLTKACFDGGLIDDILRLAPVHVPTTAEEARSRWLTAIRRHDEARNAREAAGAVCDELYGRAEAMWPEPDPIMCRRKGEFRVFTRDMMDHSSSFLKAKAEMPPHALAQLEQAVDTYEAACKRINDEVGLPRARALADQADELESEMRDELMRTPAPDAEAFALKLMLIQTFRSDGQLDDTDDLQEMMVSDDTGTWATVELYKDMMRAAGLHTPAFDLEPFDAAAWIASMEARGWRVDKHGVVCWYDPDKTLAQGPHFPAEGRQAYDALKPYQRQAVRNEAAERPDPHRPTSVLCKVRMACTILDDEEVREAELALAVARSGGASDEQMQTIRVDLDRFGWAAKFPGMDR